MSALLCVDTSAYVRGGLEGVRDRWNSMQATNRIGVCQQVRLEILYSARSADDYRLLAEELDGFRAIAMPQWVLTRALEVQQLLANVGGLHHRSVTIADLLIAAAAEAAGAIVWHYDEDFDRIAAVTGQPTDWIVPRGSL